jgi:hypothetical protein
MRRDSRPLKVLVLSTHPVGDTVGGELLLHRHIQKAPPEWTFLLHHLDHRNIRRPFWVRHLHRLPRRFQRMLNALDAWNGASVRFRDLAQLCRRHAPDVLYTIADGPVALRAWQLSRRTGIPLVAQLNDWHPGGLDIPQRLARLAAGRFRQMLRESAVALCFSEEIRLAAGAPPCARVLYPMAEERSVPCTGSPGNHALFAGRFDHFLGPEMKSLVRAAEASGEPGLLRIIGPNAHWDRETRDLLGKSALYGGLLKGDALHRELHTSLALLVLAPFGREQEHIARFSFPCKIPEYCRHERPILIWGPEYCSSVQWARRTGAALAVTSPDPGPVLEEIRRLRREPDRAVAYAQAAKQQAETTFNPLILQDIFNRALADAAQTPL